LEDVAKYLQDKSLEMNPMILPRCIWDKIGEILASDGGRSIGIDDELPCSYNRNREDTLFTNSKCKKVILIAQQIIIYLGMLHYTTAHCCPLACVILENTRSQ